MERREFLAGSAVLVALSAMPSAFSETRPEAVRSLYDKSLVIDSLCAPFAGDAFPPSEAALAEVRGAGFTAIHCTVSDRTYEGTINNLARLHSWIERYPELFSLVRVRSDIDRAKQEKKTGILPGFQDASFLDLDRLEVFRDLGVRIMQLTYNLRSTFGDGCLEPGNAGLSNAGHEAVQKMNQIGIAVDMSHSGYRTTSEAIASSAKPILVTHSGCASVSRHPRNKPDEILKALADRGGYFGIYLMPYLVASPTVPTRDHVGAHLLHAINVCGADHVGIGCDGSIEAVHLTAEQKKAFDEDIARRKQLGIGAPGEDRYPYVPDLNGPDHMEVIATELQKRGQPSSTIEKVLGLNFYRALGDIWGTA